MTMASSPTVHTHTSCHVFFFSLFLPWILHAQSDANFSFLFANLISFTVHIFLSMSASRSRFFHYCRLLFSTRLQTNVSCCFFFTVLFFTPFRSLHPTCVCFFTRIMRGNCLEIKINNFLSVKHIIYLSLLKTNSCCVWGEWSLKLLFCVCNVLLNKKYRIHSLKTEDLLLLLTRTLSSALNWKILPYIMKKSNLLSHKTFKKLSLLKFCDEILAKIFLPISSSSQI